MYKTIRHGENSLQYTILPQNDDFRAENGKLSNTYGVGRQYKNKYGKRKSFFAYFGLLFVCIVIVGAVLIPFLVSTQCLPNPTNWFMKTKSSFSKVKDFYNYKNINSSLNNKVNLSTEKMQFSTASIFSQTLIGSSKFNKNSNNLTKNIFDDENMVTSQPLKLFAFQNNHLKISKESKKHIPTTTITVEKLQKEFTNDENKIFEVDSNNVLKSQSYKKVPLDWKNREISNFEQSVKHFKKNTSIKVQLTQNIPIKESNVKALEMEELKKTDTQIYPTEINNPTTSILFEITVTDKPSQINEKVPVSISLLKKPVSSILTSQFNSNEKTLLSDQNKPENWMKSHWPFIDPSTYFQWAGYKTEDSIILPAILGVALISVLLFASFCFVIRNKRCTNSKTRKRNRIVKIEESGDDNTTLLTTSSLSDDD